MLAVLIGLSHKKMLPLMSFLLFGTLAMSVNLDFLLEFMSRYPLKSVLVMTNNNSGMSNQFLIKISKPTL